ncbi:MAG: ATP-binding cassette domain-containing protein [Buchnera aphidicola (Brevicoryne brassicae)]|uniref:ATP-binding cassette domain-containing protein n=1 Tax=Buchnera aphidicola (Brevicoryne brassicae) TaxID=911343 RepID=A0AAJ5PVB0_9GAMM|nr:ATP-binding cassette domain-containing protein [Buchnera aphidicola]QCI19925.1 ATP-binding cassette domain-containing protein [Buchnera aphidicola (Brevicoryne brassicae)]WAI18748.1 MAG: ATP-binding cassette domain-containing protein [Buchnera aphidicola (Brevicoryne brassicae)]
MSLVSIQNAYLSFSNLEILKNSTFYINKRERICLIGKNGAGKSTVLKIINQAQDLDNGKIFYKKNIKISYLEQKNPNNVDISIYDFISLGLNQENTTSNNDIILNTKKINIKDHIKIIKIIEIIQLKKNTLLSELSGGLLRKVTLSRVLIGQPDVLLLDEPTNHLDIKTVKWLESFLNKFPGSILFVSHDRNFIQNICTRIIDIDRGKLVSWPGNYKNFIKLKNESNRIEKTKKKIFDKNLKKEEKWIRTSVKARSTRNEGRVKSLQILRKENDNYQKIEQLGKIKINESKNYLGKILFKLENVNFSINNKFIIKNFSSIIEHGDKLGLIGDNGCGKSTMIKILMGEKQPQKGKIYKNTRLKISYFDQNRSSLDPNKSIIENMNYGKEQYLIKYLNNFLFKPNELKSLVKTLSGGQCNRLLLAQLFLQPSNVLILDEPTNDLDLDSLELLEKIIINYQGTVLIVSHDESFIQNTIKKCWKFENDGIINTYIGNCNSFKKEKKIYKKLKNKKNTFSVNIIQKKLKKDLDNMLFKIEKTEFHIKKLQKEINQINFFKNNLKDKLPILKALTEKEKELETQIIHWEDLEKSIIKYKN